MSEFDETHDFTKLVVDLTGFDPDESFSGVPYEKGSAFLFYLETLFGAAGNFYFTFEHFPL